ncbi:phage baseplate assembly protein V, partial [Desulfosarcina sp. OttesenSCG-928-B08]|nr:phage baseplate assembly protein V [Desulfosarcina sp. OttesenSCG-928-B08]
MMNIMETLVSMERRTSRLESNRGASLRFAEVTEVDKSGKARVQLLDGDDMISHPLRILQLRTLKDQQQWFPEVGEHVACLFAGQGFEQGVILGA